MKDDLLSLFQQHIKENNLFQQKDELLIAVSGGMDSVVLCELCFASSFKFSLAHCNFTLRGEESNRDENFVRALAKKYRVNLFVKSFDTIKIAAQHKTGIEETARKLRYNWFNEIIQESKQVNEHPIQYLLTAHHSDDNIETVLMNFCRGTGVKGLRGMLVKQDKLIRPLLFASRIEIEKFAFQNKIEYVTDSTNAENDYTRNQIRNVLIPSIQNVFPEAKKNILNNIERFKDLALLYEETIGAIIKKTVEKKGVELHIPIKKLFKLKPLNTIVFEIMKPYGFNAAQLHEVIKLLYSESGKYILSNTHRILNNRNWLIIAPLNNRNDVSHFLLEKNTNKILFPLGELIIQTIEMPESLITNAHTAFLDSSLIHYPLLLRKWKQGDYFYPLGMQKKKKLSRFLIDQKFSIIQKESVWVLESNKKIVWVVGLRLDDRFKITSKNKAILQIKYTIAN